MPLMEGTDGVQKMSKSLNNYVGFNDPPSEMFGRIMSIPDNMIYKYFELATEVDDIVLGDIKNQLADGATNPSLLKRKLAKEIIAIYHDMESSLIAEQDFDLVFKNKEIPENIPTYKPMSAQMPLVKLLTESGLFSSGNEARRQIIQGAISVNGQKVADEKMIVDSSTEIVIKAGKRKFLKVLPFI